MGYSRVGCIGCPMASNKLRYKAFKDFPKYELNYKKAFERMIAKRIEKGLEVKSFWSTADQVFDWWMEKKNTPGQLEWSDYEIVT